MEKYITANAASNTPPNVKIRLVTIVQFSSHRRLDDEQCVFFYNLIPDNLPSQKKSFFVARLFCCVAVPKMEAPAPRRRLGQPKQC
jgi:hypothetical protein